MTDLSAVPGTKDAQDPLLAAIAKAPHGPPPRELSQGTIIGHGFRIDRKLGAGGMGVVYLARDMTLERDVALKVHRAIAGLDRLQREAVAMARLAHPNVITVHEIGRVGDRLFVAMEYVAGQTLRDWFGDPPRPWREVVAMMRQVGEGLCAAHDAGLVHRDFKPENVLVGPDGRPRVGDFGLVRVVGGAPSLTTSEIELARTPAYAETIDGTHETQIASGADTIEQTPDTKPPEPVKKIVTPPSRARRGPDSKTLVPAEISTEEPDPDRLTATGAVLGTPAYMAPEQFAGERVDAKADQFAFCVVLYEGLYGQRPFAGRTPAEILRSIEQEQVRVPPPGRRAPRWLRRVIDRGLALEPADRFASMRALLAELDRGTRRRARIAAAAVLAGAVAIAAAAIALRRAPPAGTPCGSAGAELDQIWTADARKQLAQAALAVDPSLGPRITDRIGARLDGFRVAFRDAAGRACTARDVDQTWDDNLYHRARTCLDTQREHVEQLLRLPLHDRRDLAAVTKAVAQLPAPDACTRPASLAAGPSSRGGLVIGSLTDAVWQSATRIQVSLDRLDDRFATLARLDEIGAKLGDAELSAHLLFVRSALDLTKSDLPKAQTEAEQAFGGLRAAGNDAESLEATVELVRILGVDQARFDAARPWQLQAIADAGRTSFGNEDVYLAVGALEEHQSHFTEAEAAFRKALAVLEERGDNTGHTAFALGQLATALDAAGKSDDAIPYYRRAIALHEQLGGPDDPDLIGDYGDLALALMATGDLEGAIDAARRSLTLAEQWHGVAAEDQLAIAFLNLGVALQGDGDDFAAEIAFLSARHYYAALPGDHRDMLATVSQDLAFVYNDFDDFPKALAAAEDAMKDYQAAGMGDTVEWVNTLMQHARILHRAGRCAEAIPEGLRVIEAFRRLAPDRAEWTMALAEVSHCRRELGQGGVMLAELEEARGFGETHAGLARYRANVLYELAQTLHSLGKDPARARALALQARKLFVDEDPESYAKSIDEIDHTLASWP